MFNIECECIFERSFIMDIDFYNEFIKGLLLIVYLILIKYLKYVKNGLKWKL